MKNEEGGRKKKGSNKRKIGETIHFQLLFNTASIVITIPLFSDASKKILKRISPKYY